MLFLPRRAGAAVPVLGQQQLPSAEQGTAAQGTFKRCRASAEPAPSTCSADKMVQTGSSALQDEPKEKLGI